MITVVVGAMLQAKVGIYLVMSSELEYVFELEHDTGGSRTWPGCLECRLRSQDAWISISPFLSLYAVT